MARKRGKPKKSRRSRPRRRAVPPPPPKKRKRPAKRLPGIPKKKPAPKVKPGETVVHPPLRSLTIETRYAYFKGKRRVKKGTRGAKRIPYEVQLDARGKVVRTVEQFYPHKVVKTVIPSYGGSFEEEGGSKQGRIDWALIVSSVTSELNRAQRVEVSMRWQDGRGKSYRQKLELDLSKVRRRNELPQALAGLIIERLRDMGFRTQYTVKLFRQARAKGLKEEMTWNYWRSLEVARNLEMTVVLYR